MIAPGWALHIISIDFPFQPPTQTRLTVSSHRIASTSKDNRRARGGGLSAYPCLARNTRGGESALHKIAQTHALRLIYFS